MSVGVVCFRFPLEGASGNFNAVMQPAEFDGVMPLVGMSLIELEPISVTDPVIDYINTATPHH